MKKQSTGSRKGGGNEQVNSKGALVSLKRETFRPYLEAAENEEADEQTNYDPNQVVKLAY